MAGKFLGSHFNLSLAVLLGCFFVAFARHEPFDDEHDRRQDDGRYQPVEERGEFHEESSGCGRLLRIQVMGRRNHYHVYVIELSRDVLDEGRFSKCNPGYVPGKPCVYVGMTGVDPDIRFDKHKAGIQSNKYVRKFGLRLMPELYEIFD